MKRHVKYIDWKCEKCGVEKKKRGIFLSTCADCQKKMIAEIHNRLKHG